MASVARLAPARCGLRTPVSIRLQHGGAGMFGVQRFDPLRQADHTDVSEAAAGGFSQKLLEAREKLAAAPGGGEKKFGHLSGAQRRARARAKAEGREYTPTTRPVDAAPHKPKAPPAAEPAADKDAGAADLAFVDPVRRGDKKRRVQDRLDDGNAVYKEQEAAGDEPDAEDTRRAKRPKERSLDVSDGADGDEDGAAEADATEEVDEERLEKERRRRKKKKDKKKKKKAVEKNEERKRQKKAAAGEDPDAASSDEETKKPRKPKSERRNKAYELVRARAEAAQAEREDAKAGAASQGPLGQEEQAATEEAEALAAEEQALKAAEMSAPVLSLDELQSRLTEATTSRPTPQYLNEQMQANGAGGGDDDAAMDVAGLPSWLARSQQVVLPNDDEQAEAATEQEEAAPEGDVLPTGPTLDEAGVGVKGALSLAARERLGVVRLWPAQAAAIPAILSHRGDVLLSAPTGSGKTLVYTLPILHALATRVAVRLRAVVILPTRDLAMQVLSVFETLVDGGSLDIKLVAACGRERVAEESAQLAPGKVDIVVGTPGRIVAHMRDTVGFEHQLSSVEWLVIDDADRLLQQSHQDWLPRLMAAVERKPGLTDRAIAEADAHKEDSGETTTTEKDTDNASDTSDTSQRRIDAASGMSLCDWVVMNDPQMRDAEAALGWRRGVRKLILSATLTRHPAKLHSLRLHRPLHLHAATADDLAGGGSGKRFSLPTTLTERVAVVPPGGKPLALILELKAHFGSGGSGEGNTAAGGVIVFAATVETSHRLARVLQLYGGLAVSEYSARLKPEERRGALAHLADGSVQVLVCSDVLSRGIDVSGVALVLNYDAPSHAKTYIHRVGRTARAGRRGTAITLLAREEVRFFSQLRQKAGLPSIKPTAIAAFRAAVAEHGDAEARCGACLSQLESVLAHESMQLLQPTAALEALDVDAGLQAAAVEDEDTDGDGNSATGDDNASQDTQQEQQTGRRSAGGSWGRQLVELQRSQLLRRLQAVAKAAA
jgi:ATP-dependent RNA helicase DDX51/DBP6